MLLNYFRENLSSDKPGPVHSVSCGLTKKKISLSLSY